MYLVFLTENYLKDQLTYTQTHFPWRLAVEITEVRVVLKSETKLKAFASITLDDCFVIRGLKIISGAQGYFVSMPSRRRKNGSFQDLAHPINNEMRKKIEDSVLDAFESELNKAGTGSFATVSVGDESDAFD
jgi:stage V sporulation protein G